MQSTIRRVKGAKPLTAETGLGRLLRATRVGCLGVALVGFGGLTLAQSQEHAQNDPQNVRYTIQDLGDVGPLGQPFMISHDGFIAGFAAAQNGAQQATLWFHSAQLDIGMPGLGGTDSAAYGVNDWGITVGGAQTSASNPENLNAEDFCGFYAEGFPTSNTTCLPFFWRAGTMYALPTLGGPNGSAFMINDKGEVVGYAENSTQDSDCPVHQFQPVVWKNGKPHALATPGDSYGIAAYINEKGQVVGASGTCTSSFNPDTYLYLYENRAWLWDSDGTPHELKTLGGTGPFGNHACAINNLGQAAGHSETSDGATFYGVVWLDPLGPGKPPVTLMPLSGDVASFALGINDETTVVGTSIESTTTFQSTAFVWQDGAAAVTNLNNLIRSNPGGLYLALAESINNRGEIVGFGVTSTGEVHGFLAIPSDDPDSAVSASMPKPVVTDQARRMLQRALAQRGGLPR
jgi:probable HAF family extracellular repeat protein